MHSKRFGEYMKKNFIFLFLFLFSILFYSCSFGYHQFFGRAEKVDDRARTIKLIPDSEIPAVIKTDAVYSILILNDMHFGRINPSPDTKVLYDYLDSLVLQGEKLPAFIVVNGDIVHHGIQSEYDEYNIFVSEINANYGLTVFTTIGNHDCFNSGYEIFLSDVYPNTSYYKFTSNKISYYFLDTGNGTLGTPQLFDLEKNMKQDLNEKIVFTHYFFTIDKQNISALSNTKERAILLDIFNKNKVRFIGTAHSHKYNVHNYGNFIELCNNDYGKHRAIVMLYIDESGEKISFSFKKII